MKGPRARLALLTALFLVSLPAVTPRIYASDEVQYFAYLRSLWFDRDLSFDNEYRALYERGMGRSAGFRETFLELQTETGRRLNFGTIGCALLCAPFYAAGDLVARAAGAGRGWTADGYSQPYIAAVAYGSAFYGFLAIVLSAGIAVRWLGRGTLSAMLIWIGTPLLFYMYIAPPMSHACSAFAVSAFIAVWLRVRERWSARGLAALGALAALMAMVREQDAFVVVGPAMDFGRTVVARWRSAPDPADPGAATLLARAAAGCAAAGLVYLPQAASYLVLNGYVGPSRLVARKMTWTSPYFAEVLFSPSHGLFFWTPLALLAVAGLVTLAAARAAGPALRPDAAWIAACLLAIFVTQAYVAGSVESWTVAGAFGQRRFVAMTPVLIVGLAGLWQMARSAVVQGALATLAVLCVWWNLGLIAQFGAGLMDRQRLAPARSAYVSFVELPRLLPGLASRYFFERQSFYRTPGA
jgi:hypothetical protein